MYLRATIACLALVVGTILGGLAVADEHQQSKAKADELLLKASETMGLEVRDTQDEELGEVDDLVVNTHEGSVTHVLVSSGGFLGLGETILAVPVSVARFGEEEGESKEWLMVIDLKREDVKNAPSFEDDQALTKLEDESFQMDLNKFYKVDAAEHAAPDQPEDPQRTAPDQRALALASDLIGRSVMHRTTEEGEAEREDIGEIEEIVFAAKDGTIRYAALSFGGFAGIGDKLFALPWNALAFRHPADEPTETHIMLTADVNEEMLEQRDGFDEENYPRQADMGWATGPTERTAERPEPGADVIEE